MDGSDFRRSGVRIAHLPADIAHLARCCPYIGHLPIDNKYIAPSALSCRYNNLEQTAAVATAVKAPEQ